MTVTLHFCKGMFLPLENSCFSMGKIQKNTNWWLDCYNEGGMV